MTAGGRPDRTRITRLREKARTDRAELDRLLDSARVGHFALTGDDGHPVVIPTAVVRDGDRVLAHGSTGSPWMRALAGGAPTCLAVTALDGLVVALVAQEQDLEASRLGRRGRQAAEHEGEQGEAQAAGSEAVHGRSHGSARVDRETCGGGDRFPPSYPAWGGGECQSPGPGAWIFSFSWKIIETGQLVQGKKEKKSGAA